MSKSLVVAIAPEVHGCLYVDVLPIRVEELLAALKSRESGKDEQWFIDPSKAPIPKILNDAPLLYLASFMGSEFREQESHQGFLEGDPYYGKPSRPTSEVGLFDRLSAYESSLHPKIFRVDIDQICQTISRHTFGKPLEFYKFWGIWTAQLREAQHITKLKNELKLTNERNIETADIRINELIAHWEGFFENLKAPMRLWYRSNKKRFGFFGGKEHHVFREFSDQVLTGTKYLSLPSTVEINYQSFVDLHEPQFKSQVCKFLPLLKWSRSWNSLVISDLRSEVEVTQIVPYIQDGFEFQKIVVTDFEKIRLSKERPTSHFRPTSSLHYVGKDDSLGLDINPKHQFWLTLWNLYESLKAEGSL